MFSLKPRLSDVIEVFTYTGTGHHKRVARLKQPDTQHETKPTFKASPKAVAPASWILLLYKFSTVNEWFTYRNKQQ